MPIPQVKKTIALPAPVRETRAYNKGRDAFIRGVSRDENPYRYEGTIHEAMDWMTGYAHEELDCINRPILQSA
jgi:hypothetical protein